MTAPPAHIAVLLSERIPDSVEVSGERRMTTWNLFICSGSWLDSLYRFADTGQVSVSGEARTQNGASMPETL